MGTVPHSGTWSLLSKLTEGLFFLIFHEYNPSVSFADMLHEERKAFFKKKPLASLVYDRGAFRCGGNCAKLKLFGTTSTAGGFLYTKSTLSSHN